MKIVVIGGGNGSFAAVADLSEAGHDLRWWRRGGAGGIGAISVSDHAGTRQVTASATADLAAAMEGAELILVPLPATAQEDVARALAPHLVAGQVVLAMPGTFGSVAMARAAGEPEGVIFAESATLPWIARKSAPDALTITTRATLIPVGAFPASGTAKTVALTRAAFPAARVAQTRDALDVALCNGNAVLHTPLVLMNAGQIEAGGPFEPHGEGTQPAIRAVQDALDAERMAIREALGYGAPHYPLADFYGPGAWFYDNLGRDLPQVPPEPHEPIDFATHRYVAEDIMIGLAFLVSLARDCGIEAPIAVGFLAQASAILGRDLGEAPRSLTAMGLPSPGEALDQSLA